MGMNDMIQFFRQMSGKLGSSVYAGFQGPSTPQQHSFLRQLQKEMREDSPLECPLEQLPVVVFDLETTGFYPNKGDRIISIGAVKMTGSMIETDEPPFYSLVYSDEPLRPEISELTKITNAELTLAPSAEEVILQFFKYVQNRTLIAHHASHEKAFMQSAIWNLWRLRLEHRILDTTLLINLNSTHAGPLSLDEACGQCGIELKNRHHALGDAKMTAELWKYHLDKAFANGFETLQDVYLQLSKQK